MTNLSRFIAQTNKRLKLKLGAVIRLDKRRALDRRQIRELLESAIEPENLSCDGELSPNEIRERFNFYYGARNELDAYEKSLKQKKERLSV